MDYYSNFNLDLINIHNDTVYYIVITCDVKDESLDIEEKLAFKYIYNPTSYNEEKGEEKGNISLSVVFIVIGIFIVLAIIFVIFFLYLRKANLRKSVQLQHLNEKMMDDSLQ